MAASSSSGSGLQKSSKAGAKLTLSKVTLCDPDGVNESTRPSTEAGTASTAMKSSGSLIKKLLTDSDKLTIAFPKGDLTISMPRCPPEPATPPKAVLTVKGWKWNL